MEFEGRTVSAEELWAWCLDAGDTLEELISTPTEDLVGVAQITCDHVAGEFLHGSGVRVELDPEGLAALWGCLVADHWNERVNDTGLFSPQARELARQMLMEGWEGNPADLAEVCQAALQSQRR